MCILQARSLKQVSEPADAMLLSPFHRPETTAVEGNKQNLPLQMLSHNHRGWLTALGESWFPPPGGVCVGCPTDTPSTWTASAAVAALGPAPRCHGNQLCTETRVRLVKWKQKGRGRNQLEAPPQCSVAWRVKTQPTNFVLSRVVRNLKGVQLEAAVTLSDVVDAGDVRAHFIHNLHELQNNTEHKALASQCSQICMKRDMQVKTQDH